MVLYGTDVDGIDDVPDWVQMTGLQLFLGAGQAILLGETLEVLYFKNDGSTTDANVSVFVGRATIQRGG